MKLTNFPKILGAVLCLLTAFVVVGCSKKRPDPRENPEFNEEAYNDPDAAMKAMQGAKVKKK